jgi:uncharacterized protein (DUF1330 family)
MFSFWQTDEDSGKRMATPPVYYVAELTVRNPDAFAKEFAPKAQSIIKAHGGRYLAIGGSGGGPGGAGAAGKVTEFDEEPPQRLVVLVWDSVNQIRAWHADPEYQALRKTGEKYATFRSFAVEGLSQ